MLKGTILRQVRLCRLPTTLTLVAASRTATRPAPQSWLLSNRRCIVPTASSWQFAGRGGGVGLSWWGWFWVVGVGGCLVKCVGVALFGSGFSLAVLLRVVVCF